MAADMAEDSAQRHREDNAAKLQPKHYVKISPQRTLRNAEETQR